MSGYKKNKKKKPSYEDLKQKIKNLEFTVNKRGYRIKTLHYALECLIENSPNRIEIKYTENTDLVNSLKTQLTDARNLLIKKMKEPENSKEEKEESKNPFLNADCCVCFEKYDENEKRPVIISCGHIYCQICILKYQEGKNQPTCPRCRKVFTSFIPLFI